MALQIALGVVSSVLGACIMLLGGYIYRYTLAKRKIVALNNMLNHAASDNRLLRSAMISQNQQWRKRET